MSILKTDCPNSSNYTTVSSHVVTTATSSSDHLPIIANVSYSEPVAVVHAIPGTIQAEAYSTMNGVVLENTTDIGGGQNVGFLNTNALGFNANYKPSKKGNIASSVFLNSYEKNYQRLVDRTTFFTDSSLLSREGVNQKNTSLNNRANIHYKQEENHLMHH